MENPKALRYEIDSRYFEFLPFEIIIEILARLPVKVLGRFCIVSKLWYSLITSSMFINKHLKNHSLSVSSNACSSGSVCNNILLIPTVIKELERHSYSLFCDKTFVERGSFDIPMLYHWLEILYIGNSCNGIICFTDQKAFFGRKVCLYNPTIRKIKLISYNCFADKIFDRNKVFSKLGFGFCECVNDFKVVRIHYIKDDNSRMLGNVPPEVEVYSLNADRWRRIRANVKCIVNYKSVACNGSIYWLARRKDKRVFDTIMSFDIDREVFCEIELPRKCNFMDGTILVFKGLLALFKDAVSNIEDGRLKCYELWVMREYKVAKTWTKLSILETKRSVVKAFGFTKNGKLVMQMAGDMLASWDPEKNNLTHLKIDGFLNHVDAAFVESLVLYEGGWVASADKNTIVAETSQSMMILQPRDLLLKMGTRNVLIHGDDVVIRVAADVAMVECGVSELKSLCWRRPALVCIMSKSRDVHSTLQFCVENYCLIVQQDYFDRVPESLREFLANPEICFMSVGPDRLYLGPFYLKKNGIEFSDLVYRVLGKYYFSKWGLKPIADEVGVTLEEYPVGFGLALRTEAISAEDIKCAISHAYASYKIGYKLLCSL